MTYRPFPPRPGAGGGGGSYDDTALRARVAAGETTNATQDGAIRDHAGRLLKIEETPAFDDATLRMGIGDLSSALAAEARDRVAGDRALADRADTADVAAGRLAERISGLESRPAPVPYDDTALSGRVGAVETGVEGLDGRLKTVEGRPATAPYDDDAIRTAISDETAARTAADTALDERLDGAETAITAHAGRLKTIEDRPVPAAYDDTAIRGRLGAAEESIGAVDGRVKTLEGQSNPVPYDDTPLRGRVTALETADREFDDALDGEIDARTEADRQLGLRIDAVSSAGYDDTALSTRIKTLEDRPAPVAFDDTALREADRQLGLRIDGLPAPFDPAYLVAADAALAERVDGHDGFFGQIRDGMNFHVERLTVHERVLSEHQQKIADFEARPGSTPFDPSALEAADIALGERIDALGSGGGSGGILRLLGKRRIRVSGAVDLDTIVPAGTAVVEVEAIGGGASGVSSRHSTGNSPAYAHGGNPGEVARGRLKFEPGLRLEILVGAGGATALAQASTTATGILQNAGSATSLSVKKAGAEIGAVVAAGGRTWGTTNGTGTFPSTALATARSEAREALVDRDGALGGLATASTGVNTFGLAHGQPAVDRPSAGGACVYQATGATDSANGGNGGTVTYSIRLGSPPLSVVAGGHGAVGHSAATYADATPGLNPLPDEAGSYGSGGGGSRYRNANPFSYASAGAFPGGGGGGAYTRSDMPDQESPAGAGGDGCVDLYFYGVAA